MNAWPLKLTLLLFLVLGLNVFVITHAHSREPINVKEEITRLCPIKGQVYLRLSGTLKNGQLHGWINNESVWWSVFSGRVSGFINGHSVMLTMKEHGSREYSLVGWAGTQRVDWRSFGGVFDEWINCY